MKIAQDFIRTGVDYSMTAIGRRIAQFDCNKYALTVVTVTEILITGDNDMVIKNIYVTKVSLKTVSDLKEAGIKRGVVFRVILISTPYTR